MKLQPASQKELAYVAKGTALCTAALLAVFAVLGAAGLVPFGWQTALGAVCGCAVAVLNFYLLCLTVQSAAGMQDVKALKAKVQASYNGRLLMQGLWVLAAVLAPCFQPVASVLPLLFPNLLIYVRQAAGKKKSEPSSGPSEPNPEGPDPS